MEGDRCVKRSLVPGAGELSASQRSLERAADAAHFERDRRVVLRDTRERDLDLVVRDHRAAGRAVRMIADDQAELERAAVGFERSRPGACERLGDGGTGRDRLDLRVSGAGERERQLERLAVHRACGEQAGHRLAGQSAGERPAAVDLQRERDLHAGDGDVGQWESADPARRVAKRGAVAVEVHLDSHVRRLRLDHSLPMAGRIGRLLREQRKSQNHQQRDHELFSHERRSFQLYYCNITVAMSNTAAFAEGFPPHTRKFLNRARYRRLKDSFVPSCSTTTKSSPTPR
jgi:hypothetical protein